MARKQEIMPYLESLHRELKIPVLYVSHSRDEVARLGDHMVLLEAGHVEAAGPVYEIFSRLDLSLAHEPDAETVIEAVIAAHDAEFDLTYLDFDGGRFAVAHSDLPPGSAVRLQVPASDVSLTLEHQSGTSILNIFAATVEEIASGRRAQATVRLRVGRTPMLARVTRKSVSELGLQPGKAVYAQVKSAALLS
jgi:molybdate transport system ATP-binding protein